jgi:hypothetical protein
VEKLTLHMIEMKKENEELKIKTSKLQFLAAEIATIKQRIIKNDRGVKYQTCDRELSSIAYLTNNKAF